MTFRTKLIIGSALGLIVLCGGVGWFVSSNYRQTTIALQDSAAGEGDYILSTLGKSWSMADLLDVASGDFLTVVPEQKQKEEWLAKMKKELGAYKDGGGQATPIKAVKGAMGDTALGSVYTNEATFEKKKAKIQIQLIQREKGGWQMASFDATPIGAAAPSGS